MSALFAVCLLAGGIANAIYGSENADKYDKVESLCVMNGIPSLLEELCEDLKRVRDTEIAAAVSTVRLYKIYII